MPEVNTIVFDIESNKVLTIFELITPISDHNTSKQIVIDEVGNIPV